MSRTLSLKIDMMYDCLIIMNLKNEKPQLMGNEGLSVSDGAVNTQIRA